MAISGSLVIEVSVGALTALDFGLSISIVSVVTLVLIVHGLFVNGPLDSVDDLSNEVVIEEFPVIDTTVSLIE